MTRQFNHQTGDYLAIDGARIYYEEMGPQDKPVLLFLHSGGGSLDDFNSILPGIPETFRIIGIDSRGHGGSTRGPHPLTFERLQMDAEAILNHLNVGRLSIFGFSDGGIVAYRLAALSSLTVTRLITIGSRGYVKHGDPNKADWLKLTGDSLKKQEPAQYDTYQRLNPEPDFDGLVNDLVSLWLDPTDAGHPNDRISAVACPVLLARGDRDIYLSREAIVENADAMKNASLLNIPFATHPAFKDQKKIFLDALNTFLEHTEQA